jgi:hypothetical protein
VAEKKECGLTAAGTPRKRPPRKGGGRPTKYRPEYCEQIIEYFDRPPQQMVYKKTYYASGQIKSEEPVVLAEQFPTFQGFADTIEVHIDTLHEWRKVHEEFSEAYARAQQLQEKIWLVNGMGGQYNSQFAQFFGKNCLGYKDRQETELSGGLDVHTNKLDAILEQLNEG